MEATLDFITLILIITWLISQTVLFVQLNKRIKRVEVKLRMTELALQVQKDINDLTMEAIKRIKSNEKGKE